MKKSERARRDFVNGASCSQAVFSAFAVEYGLCKETAMKLGSGFSGGMGRMGNTCGAVTGAIMTIGLALGGGSIGDSEAKNNAMEKVGLFLREFENKFDTTECRALTGYDLADPEELDRARAANVFSEKCPAFVEGAARILEKILNQDTVLP